MTKAPTEEDLDKAAAVFAQLMISGVNIAQALFTRRGGTHQPNSVVRMRAHGGSGGGKKPAGVGGSRTPPAGGGSGKKPLKKRVFLTAIDELKDIKLVGRNRADIETDLRSAGYSPVPARSGGTVWTKPMPDGNTAIVRVDPAVVRSPPKGFADEVPHAHKEIVPTTQIVGGDYDFRVTKPTVLDESGTPSSDKRLTHIPITW